MNRKEEIKYIIKAAFGEGEFNTPSYKTRNPYLPPISSSSGYGPVLIPPAKSIQDINEQQKAFRRGELERSNTELADQRREAELKSQRRDMRGQIVDVLSRQLMSPNQYEVPQQPTPAVPPNQGTQDRPLRSIQDLENQRIADRRKRLEERRAEANRRRGYPETPQQLGTYRLQQKQQQLQQQQLQQQMQQQRLQQMQQQRLQQMQQQPAGIRSPYTQQRPIRPIIQDPYQRYLRRLGQ